MKNKKYDFFICHASEDKETFVKHLAAALQAKGFTTWYDEYELNIGDSLTHSIQEGIKNSLYGVIVISKNFFKKQWTKKEFNALFSKEIILEENILLPIWLDVTKEEVYEFSPFLVDRFAIEGNLKSMDKILKQLSKKTAPQITTAEMLDEKIKYLILCDSFKRKKEEIEMLHRLDKIFAYQNESFTITDGVDFIDGNDGYTQEQEDSFFIKEEELRKEYNLPKGLWLNDEPFPEAQIQNVKATCVKWINRKLSKGDCDDFFWLLEELLDTDICYILYGFPYHTIKTKLIYDLAIAAIKKIGSKKEHG